MSVETLRKIAIRQSIFWLVVLLGAGTMAENINIATLQMNGKTIVCFSF